jgi:hypothetical protein
MVTGELCDRYIKRCGCIILLLGCCARAAAEVCDLQVVKGLQSSKGVGSVFIT